MNKVDTMLRGQWPNLKELFTRIVSAKYWLKSKEEIFEVLWRAFYCMAVKSGL